MIHRLKFPTPSVHLPVEADNDVDQVRLRYVFPHTPPLSVQQVYALMLKFVTHIAEEQMEAWKVPTQPQTVVGLAVPG